MARDKPHRSRKRRHEDQAKSPPERPHKISKRRRVVIQAPESPLRQKLSGKQAPTAKKTVSAAGLFKKKEEKNDKTERHKYKKEIPAKPRKSNREKAPEHPLSIDLHAGIKEARKAINANLLQEFDAVYSTFMNSLTLSKEADTSFLNNISTSLASLSRPISSDSLELKIRQKDGQISSKTETLGQMVANFEAATLADEAKLVRSWAAWEALGDKFVALGRDVFGSEAFGVEASGGEKLQGGFQVEMEAIEKDFGKRIEEMGKEIEGARVTALKSMRSMENAAKKKTDDDTAKLLQALIADD